MKNKPAAPKTTHTPGPWILYKGPVRIEVQMPADPIGAAYAFSLQDEANARLIAASPELLEVLKSLELMIRVNAPLHDGSVTHKAIVDAISKATGEGA